MKYELGWRNANSNNGILTMEPQGCFPALLAMAVFLKKIKLEI